jgi:hypothetical protein
MPTYTSTESPTATEEPPSAPATERETAEQPQHSDASRSRLAPIRLVITGATVRAFCDRLSRVIVILTIFTIAVIALGIVFDGLGANSSKWLVSDVKDAARWLASPFDKTFVLHSAKLGVALNWCIAIVVYAVVGRLLRRLIQGLPNRLHRSG